jgi:hypothetical protein
MMRALQLAIVVVMATWLFGTLGGVKLSPRPVPGGKRKNKHCKPKTHLNYEKNPIETLDVGYR